MSHHAFLIVVPVADRPRQIQSCLESLCKALRRFPYAGRIRVLLADDSAEAANIEAHRATMRRFSRHGLEVIHFPPDEQLALLRSRGITLPRVLGELPRETQGRYGHKGQGVTRNLAYLKAAELLKAESAETLIWSIDSDQEFRVDAPADDGFVIDYFDALDAIFTQTDVEVLTGKVVGDPPVSPAVMTRNFLDDVLAFLDDMAQRDPAAACSHHDGPASTGDAAYHDMAELFGFKPAARHAYPCPLHGAHTEAACFANFAQRVNSFFYGEHPTRISAYLDGDPFASLQPARTVYAGNYVFRPDALKYFIPFAHLHLRMSGPTLGRILKAEIGPRFLSANLPMLHRRTVASGGQAEFRPGIETAAATIDIGGEFERQFYGDVMLFTVERLCQENQGCRAGAADFATTLDATHSAMLARYNERQQAILDRLARLEALLADTAHWWHGQAAGFRRFAENVRLNFGPTASAPRAINDAANWSAWRSRLIDALAHYADDRIRWARFL